jgi:hypothetical protein
MNRTKSPGPRKLSVEAMEPRLCMAASSGWDGPGRGGAALSYYLGAVPANAGVSQAEFETAIQAALDVWAKVADVTFAQTNRPGLVDALDITFAYLDRVGGTLAQAYFPDDVNSARIAGDVQFDAHEAWEVGNQRGSAAFDLLAVAVHEIGHALGLDHSHATGSIMAASISASEAFVSLSPSDRTAILQLYAPSRELGGTATPSTNPANIPSPPTPTTPITPTSPSVPTLPTEPRTTRFHPWLNFRWYRWWSARRSFGGLTEVDSAAADAPIVDAAFSGGESNVDSNATGRREDSRPVRHSTSSYEQETARPTMFSVRSICKKSPLAAPPATPESLSWQMLASLAPRQSRGVA